jgi:hypothetical protein
MAALWWTTNGRFFDGLIGTPFLTGLGWNSSEAVLPVLQTYIAKQMSQEMGFTDVRTNGLEVAGGKFDVWASIVYVDARDPAQGEPRDEWEVVMTSGDTAEDAKAVNDELVFMLSEMFAAAGGPP